MTASKLIALAKAEVGYLEKRSNSNLDSKTANAGSNNYTKYARDLSNAGYYNGNKNGYPWCDVFVDWLFWQLCGKDRTKAEKMTCQTGPYGAGCTYSAQYYQKQGRLYGSPKPGDQIFFYDSGRTEDDHTGVVIAVDSNYVYTIEGNTSGASGVIANGGGVCEKKYNLGYSRIHGYGRPYYDEESGATVAPAIPKPTTKPETTKGETTVTVELTMLSKGSSGAQVRTLQQLLIAKGYSLPIYGADADFGGETDTAVRKFQKAKGIEVDGIVGKDTWTRLIKG